MAFIDKINPDVPKGRLLIRNGEFILKYPDAEVSKIPLDKKRIISDLNRKLIFHTA